MCGSHEWRPSAHVRRANSAGAPAPPCGPAETCTTTATTATAPPPARTAVGRGHRGASATAATPPVLVTPLSRDRRAGRPWRRVDVGAAAPERCAWCHASDGAALAACRASGRDPGPATRCRPPGLPPSDGDAVVAGLAAGAKRVIGQGHGDDRIGRMAVPEQIIDPAVLVLAIEGLKPRQLEFVALQGRDVVRCV